MSAPSQGTPPSLLRQIGFAGVTALMISNRIGNGILATTG
jgi:hypothetical protein